MYCLGHPTAQLTGRLNTYVFNQLQQQLTHRLHSISNDNDLVREVQSVITNLTGMDATFVHCGYL